MTKLCGIPAKLVPVSWKTARPGEELDHRLQLLIASRMLARVREIAGRRGVSASELIRQFVADALDRLDAEDARRSE